MGGMVKKPLRATQYKVMNPEVESGDPSYRHNFLAMSPMTSGK